MRMFPSIPGLRLLALLVGVFSSVSLAGASNEPPRAGVETAQKGAVVVPQRSVAERAAAREAQARRDRAASTLTAMAEPAGVTFEAPYSWQGLNQRVEAQKASEASEPQQGLQPGFWSGILSTLLLGIFFLFRRMT